MSKPWLLIIQCGNTFPDLARRNGDFDRWFARVLDGQQVAWQSIAVHDLAPLPDETTMQDCMGILITGSPAMVTQRLPWSEALACWLRGQVAQQRPVFGVCYGHQLLAHAFGGRVDYHEGGREIGSLEIECLPESRSDPIFASLPGRFTAHLTHMQSVLELPPEAVVLARGEQVSIQAFRLGSSCWGVQFHPEFDEFIMQAYLDHFGTPAHGSERVSARPCPDARAVMIRFVEFCHGRKVS